MKLQVNLTDLNRVKISKYRNSKSNSITFIDPSGKPIKGHPVRHFMKNADKQQQRFNTKFEAYNLLDFNSLENLYKNPIKPQVQGNTDKAALTQCYYNALIKQYENKDIDELKNLEVASDVEKEAKKHVIKIKSKQELINV